jgi:hypothetical protein
MKFNYEGLSERSWTIRWPDENAPLQVAITTLRELTISQLNELSQEIRKARKRLKYDDRAKELK